MRRYFRWAARPQLLVGFVVACLCANALGSVVRSAYALTETTDHPRIERQVKGSSKTIPAPDCAVVACLALTFDDGPDPAITPRILEILARQHIRATFFIVGMHVAGSEPLLRQMYAQGSEIGNHSWDHADFTKLSPAQMQDELQRTQAAIISAGVPAPYLFRPPYGAVDATVLGQVTSYTIARWNIDTEDWLTKDPVKISEHLLHDARPGGVILMHDRYDATVTSLEPALETLKQSYQFVTLGQLLNTTPGDHGQYFGR